MRNQAKVRKERKMRKVMIKDQESPYQGDKDCFYAVYINDKKVKSFIINFADAVNFALTLSDKVYYSSK